MNPRTPPPRQADAPLPGDRGTPEARDAGTAPPDDPKAAARDSSAAPPGEADAAPSGAANAALPSQADAAPPGQVDAAPPRGPVVFTRAGFRRGARVALALAPGMVPFGLVVGVVAANRGLSLAETLLMSALVFAGTSQLVALELWSEPAPILGATLAALVINLRLAPMGAALAPWLDRLRGVRLWGTLATLVDNSFAASIADLRRGGRDAALLLGIGLVMWLCWTIVTGIGHATAGLIRLDPRHPVFFAGLASILAITVPIWRGRGDAASWLVAALAAVAAHLAGLGAPWPVLAGALLGAAYGAWRDTRA